MYFFWFVCDFKKGEGMGKKDLSIYVCVVFMGNQKGVVGERCVGELVLIVGEVKRRIGVE